MRKTKAEIPAPASLILKIITLGDYEFSMIGEIAEEFDDIAARKGPPAPTRSIL